MIRPCALRQARGPCAAGHPIHAPRKQMIDATKHTILLMQGPWTPRNPRRGQCGNGGITTKTYDNIGLKAALQHQGR